MELPIFKFSRWGRHTYQYRSVGLGRSAVAGMCCPWVPLAIFDFKEGKGVFGGHSGAAEH